MTSKSEYKYLHTSELRRTYCVVNTRSNYKPLLATVQSVVDGNDVTGL